MCRSPVILSAAVVALLARAASADTLESVEKKIAERSKKITSLSAVMKTVMDMSGPGYKNHSVMTGPYEYVVKGDKTLFRTEATTQSKTDAGGQTMNMTTTTLSICDGQFAYTLTDANGQKSAMKMKMEKTPVDPFESYRAANDLRLLKDETIDGNPTWVIEAVPKTRSSPASKERTVLWYQQSTGWMVRMITCNAAGEPQTTTTYSEVKINAPIKDDRFVFKAPPGVTVTEMPGKP